MLSCGHITDREGTRVLTEMKVVILNSLNSIYLVVFYSKKNSGSYVLSPESNQYATGQTMPVYYKFIDLSFLCEAGSSTIRG